MSKESKSSEIGAGRSPNLTREDIDRLDEIVKEADAQRKSLNLLDRKSVV